ncbi:MAG: class I SAM-dependent methyltransferase [Promethearchaeota archaeon]
MDLPKDKQVSEENLNNLNNSEKEVSYKEEAKMFAQKIIPYYWIVDLLLKKNRKRFASMLDLPDGSKVLDIGTGPGSQVFSLLNKNYKIIAIDISEKMLEKAEGKYHKLRKKCTKKIKRGCSDIEFRLMDALDLHFEDNSFDAVTIGYVFHDMPHPIRIKALNEIKRVCKPNGLFVISEYNEYPKKSQNWFFRFAERFETPYYKQFLGLDFEEFLKSKGLEVLDVEYSTNSVTRIIKCKNLQ